MSKAALVTGASQGLGLEFCKELIARGYFVAALDLRISEELKALEGDALQIIECDVACDASVKKAEEAMSAQSLDLIINNAGIWLDKERRALSDPDFEFETMIKQYQVNALGVVRIARAFMPKLLKGEGKTMVNISSEAGSIAECGRKAEYGYCMSKAAQNMATKMMQNEYGEQGVKLYAVHPGWMQTPQGYASADDVNKPRQSPVDSAKVLLDLAEGEPKSGMYYDVVGKEWQW